jgi:hypothetical protein
MRKIPTAGGCRAGPEILGARGETKTRGPLYDNNFFLEKDMITIIMGMRFIMSPFSLI